jgi:hypothetical protein
VRLVRCQAAFTADISAGAQLVNGPGQSPTRNAQDTGSRSYQHLPNTARESTGVTRITRVLSVRPAHDMNYQAELTIATVSDMQVSAEVYGYATPAHRHERKCLGVTSGSLSCARALPPASATMQPRRTVPCAHVPRAHHGKERPARAAQLPGTPRALQPAVREQVPARAAQPPAGQIAGQMANTPRNTRVRPPHSCYSYCMISPLGGDLTGFRVQVPRTR